MKTSIALLDTRIEKVLRERPRSVEGLIGCLMAEKEQIEAALLRLEEAGIIKRLGTDWKHT